MANLEHFRFCAVAKGEPCDCDAAKRAVDHARIIAEGGDPEMTDDDELCGSAACREEGCTFNDHDTFDLYDETQATDEEPWGPSIGTRGGEGALACAMHGECNNFVRTGKHP